MHFPKKNIYSRFFHLLGFKLINQPPPEFHKCIVIYVPHTSNWDYVLGVTCLLGLGMPVRVAIKEFWTRWPFGIVIKRFGGIGIDRSHDSKVSHVDVLAKAIATLDKGALVVTPEGSRKLRTKWKTGFYYIAQKANVPIVTIKGNYADKTAEFGPVILPTATKDEAMITLMQYFKDSKAKFPEWFAVDERYV